MNKYTDYKQSGVPWIGNMPEHWELKRGKFVTRLLSGYPFNSDLFSKDDSDMPLIRIRDISSDSTESFYSGKYPENYIIHKGDVLVGMDGDFNVAVWKGPDGLLNQRVLKVEDTKKMKAQFMYYALPHLLKCINDVTYSTTVKHLSTFDIYGAYFPVPSIEEQEAIVAYLDIKCADIDKAIATQQKRIILLNELRQNVICKLLTKGIDSSCALKGTKISSVGKIPSHWEIRKIKWILKKGKDGIKIGPFGSSLTGKVDSSYDYKVYGQWNIIASNFSAGQSYVSEDTFKELQGYEVKPSDILISMMGTVGKCSVVPNNIEQGIMDSHVVKIRLDERICNSQFFEFVYDKDYSQIVKSQIDRVKKGSIMDGLNSSLIKELFVPVPPIQEQTAIVHEIKKQIEPIDLKIQSSQSQIDLLSKYRKSLIYEAVTGKFHV